MGGPIKEKTVIVDDSCFLMGFDNYQDALITLKILNSDVIQEFSHSLIFYDAKRVINKDLLMRIDLIEALSYLNHNDLNISAYEYKSYIQMLKKHITPIQKTLF